MTKKVFIWVAHPAPNSLCKSLANAYQSAAANQGAEIRVMNLSDMKFEMDEFSGYGKVMPPLEQDLKDWQDNVSWADHIFFVHPYWWGAMPAKAKSVIDRALLPRFGFKYHNKGIGWDKLLKGKTADVIITSDTPPLLDTLLYRKPGRRVIKNQILGFCGIKTKNIQQFGSVKMADNKKISGWLARAGKMGRKAAGRRLQAQITPLDLAEENT